jgi:hypothetical protein
MTMPVLRDAACRTPAALDVFDRINDTERPVPGDVNAARRVCLSCPVRAACLEWAVHHEDRGVWAALTKAQLRKLRAQRKIKLERIQVGEIAPRPRPASEQRIRVWAERHGYPLGARGGIPASLRAAYEAMGDES